MKKIGRRLARQFADIIGTENFLTNPADLHCYSYDASGYAVLPWAVALPENKQQISTMLSTCFKKGIPVIPRGAGSGTTGASVPAAGGLVISLTRMRRIKSIDPVELSVTVEPGVVTGHLQNEVERLNLFYPPDPASLSFCTIGGNVNTGAGGARAVKYGVTKDYVKALEVVLADGSIIQTGAATSKGVVGYDLTHLFVGSEGTLGIITEITLKLIPKADEVGTILALFKNVDDAVDSVTCLFNSGVLPRCAEFLDRMSLKCVKDLLPIEILDNAAALLIIEVDGPLGSISGQLRRVKYCFEQNNVLDIFGAKDDRHVNQIWKARRGLSPAIKRLGFQKKVSEDICLPRSKVSAMLRSLENISNSYPMTILSFGHIGDGNLHVNLLWNPLELPSEDMVEKIIRIIMKKTVELGGTISGEHGIGLAKKSFIGLELSKKVVYLEKGLKRVFDPKNIMNPYKVFED